MANPWDAFPAVEQKPAPPSQAPSGRVFIPDQGAIDDASRADTSLGYQGNADARADRGEGREISKDARQGMGDLRKEFTALPEVKKYGTVVQQVDTILHTRPDAAGDQDLLYAIAQLRDPLGSVREGDSDMIAGGQSAFDRNVQELKRQLGHGGQFTDEYRKQLRKEAISRLNTANRAYSQARNQYAEIAQAANYDPSLVIGPHAGTPFVERFKAYDEANGPRPTGQGVGVRGPIPGATPDNITFDIDTGSGAFGSEIQADRLTAQQQAGLSAALRANAGNPNFGPDTLRAIYQGLGVPVGEIPDNPAFFEAVRTGKAFDTSADPTAADAEMKRRAMEASFKEIPEGDDVSSAGRDKGLLFNWTDELRGGVGGIKSLFRGEGFQSGYQQERDIERALQERSRQENGIWPELAGGLMTPVGFERAPTTLGEFAAQGAKYGSLAGAGEGEGFPGTVGGTLVGGGLGALTAAGGKAGLDKLAQTQLGQKATSSLARQSSADRTAFAEAADRQGLDYLAADIPGAKATQWATSITKSTLGGIPLSEAAGKIAQKARDARDRIARGAGRVASDEAGAGQAVRRGMEAWERKTEGRGGELFEAIPIPPKTEVGAENTRAALAEITRGMESNPELSRLWTENQRMKATLEALTPVDVAAEGAQELAAAGQRLTDARGAVSAAQSRVLAAEDAQRALMQGSGSNWGATGGEIGAARREVEAAKSGLADATSMVEREMAAVAKAEQKASSTPVGGKISWEDMRRLRSIVGQIAGKPSLSSDGAADAAMRKFYGALTQDIEQAAVAHSAEAAKASTRANNYWRGRQDRIDSVMVSLLGRKGDASAETTFRQVERWASAKGGDFSKLARAIRSLPDDEANSVRATIIDRLGNAGPGSQGAANDNFSPDVFLTQWSKLSDRAKGVLFQGEHRKALDDLATVFEGTKFSRSFDNTSKTAIGVNATALAGTGLVSVPAAVALSALQFGGGKLLASPRFARWLVALGKKPNASAQLAHVQQLTAIAKSEPIIANDVFGLQQRLADAFAQPQSLRSAAKENDDVGDTKVSERERDGPQ